jgi:hypothetical protein
MNGQTNDEKVLEAIIRAEQRDRFMRKCYSIFDILIYVLLFAALLKYLFA